MATPTHSTMPYILNMKDGYMVTETPSDSTQSRIDFLNSFTPKERKAIMRKVDNRFLFLIGMMLVIKNIDSNNAALAKVLQVGQPSNIMNELHMTSDDYNWVQSIYFISYILFEIPSNLLLKKMTPRHWQSRIVMTWGLVLACHGAIQNASGYYAARFFLGAMEGGLFPGLMAQLCGWYRSDEIAKPIMWMFGWLCTSGVWGALIAYGVSYMNGVCGLSAWRWLYILEGVFTMIFSLAIFIWLPDYPKSPRSKKWLTPREQDYIEARLSSNAPQTSDPAFNQREVLAALKDLRLYSFTLQQFLLNLASYAMQWQLPTVTTSLGFAGLPRNQLLNIPPAAAGVLLIIISACFISRAYVTRPLYALFLLLGALIFFIILAIPGVSKSSIYTACVLGTAFYSAYFIPLWSWRSSTLSGSTGTAFVISFQNCVGQVGGVVAPQLFREKYKHNGYKTSFAICAGAMGAAAVANCWSWWLTWEVEGRVRRERMGEVKGVKDGMFEGEEARTPTSEERGWEK